MAPHDLVLSSGFLAFARHLGFLDAVEDAMAHGWLEVDGICGTSSGSLTGALWAAGWPARRIADELSLRSPLRWMRVSSTPWRGLFAMGGVVEHLSRLLPARIEDLERPFGVGVIDASGAPRVLTEGPLSEAVAASCAMPTVFTPVRIGDADWQDGGARDRIGLTGWRAHRGERPTVVHRVMRSAGPASGPLPPDVVTVESGRSGATFLSLGDLHGQAEESRAEAWRVLRARFAPPGFREEEQEARGHGGEVDHQRVEGDGGDGEEREPGHA